MLFIFKRAGSEYLQLSGYLTPAATALASSQTKIVISDSAMAATGVLYTLSVVTGQGLGLAPALVVTVPSTLALPVTPVCSVSLSTFTLSTSSCVYSSSEGTLTYSLTASILIPVGTNITLSVQAVTNPPSLISLLLGLTTYYSSVDPTSRVEYAAAAFSVTTTGISHFPCVLSPASLTVYSVVSTQVALTTTVDLPAGSLIYVEYPASATELAVGSTPLTVSGISQAVAGSVHANNSYSLTTNQTILANSSITLTASIRTPSSVGTYNYLILRVTYATTMYL